MNEARVKSNADLQRRILRDDRAGLFLKTLWEEEAWAKLFLAHRETLLPTEHLAEIRITLPFLFLDSLPHDARSRLRDGRILKASVDRQSLEAEAGRNDLEIALGVALDSIKEVGALLALRLMQRNTPLRSRGKIRVD